MMLVLTRLFSFDLSRFSTADAWAPLAQKLLDDYGESIFDGAI